MSQEFIFPFNSPPTRDGPELPHALNPIKSSDLLQSPNPGTLQVQINPSSNIVADKLSIGETLTFRTAKTKMATASAFIENLDDNFTFPTIPRPIHSRPEVQSATLFEGRHGHCNPFSDEYELELTPPLKPWVEPKSGRSLTNVRTTRSSSMSSSLNSSPNFCTAAPSSAQVNYSHPYLPHRPSLSTSQGRPSLSPSTSGGRPSLSPSSRRNTKSSVYTLDREVRLREHAKAADRKLRLERAKDEVRRLAKEPSASTSRISLALPSIKSFNNTSKDYKNPVPSLITNGFFWCALLLLQTGFVSTGAAFAILMNNRGFDGKIKAGTGIVFWLVCSVGALVIGVVAAGIMCARKGNACLTTQDMLGFNEIRDLSGDGLERGRGGGRLFYLGVGERDDGSTLGGGSNSLRESLSARFIRNGENRVGEWVVGNGNSRSSMDSTLKDPIWKDLYLTPSSSRAQFNGSDGSPEPRTRSKLRAAREAVDQDLAVQRLKLTPPLIRVSGDGETSTRMIPKKAVAGLGSNTQDRDADKQYHSIAASTKSSMVSATSMMNDYTGVVGKEIDTWSPLDRLGRALSGDVPTLGATSNQQENVNGEDDIELIDMSIPYDKIEGAKSKATAERKNSKGKGNTWASEQVAEWSPEIIQQRMKKRLEEKERERLKQLKEDKGKVEGIDVKERAKRFETSSASMVSLQG